MLDFTSVHCWTDQLIIIYSYWLIIKQKRIFLFLYAEIELNLFHLRYWVHLQTKMFFLYLKVYVFAVLVSYNCFNVMSCSWYKLIYFPDISSIVSSAWHLKVTASKILQNFFFLFLNSENKSRLSETCF